MVRIGKEATDFVRVCEAIHSLLGDERLAPGDRDLIEFSAAELLSKLKPVHPAHLGTLLPGERPPALGPGSMDGAAN